MVESNYDILGIGEGTTEKEIRDAFRRLGSSISSDRGGENEQFIKIKQAYEDLKIGKKYPETDIEKIKNSRVYSDESEADVRRKNQILGQQLSKEMKTAEEWAAAHNRANSTGTTDYLVQKLLVKLNLLCCVQQLPIISAVFISLDSC